jgi:hypothetical protein
MGASSSLPNSVVDVEGGAISARDIKVAREVAEEVMSEQDQLRLSNLITDLARDTDTALTRATRDRDRATPRDVSHVDSRRLRRELPAEISYRGTLSARQRKVRSAVKNQVMAAAPRSQHRAVETMLTGPDPAAWQRINIGLHDAAGDVHNLDDNDRIVVQRLDRAIQSYERCNDRAHTVYVSVRLPESVATVFDKRDLPVGLGVGSHIAFDQFTPAAHNIHELAGHDDQGHVVLELVTSRGMYMGRSGTGDDTSHILPRGMHLQLTGACVVPYHTPSGRGERLVVQAREISTAPTTA